MPSLFNVQSASSAIRPRSRFVSAPKRGVAEAATGSVCFAPVSMSAHNLEISCPRTISNPLNSRSLNSTRQLRECSRADPPRIMNFFPENQRSVELSRCLRPPEQNGGPQRKIQWPHDQQLNATPDSMRESRNCIFFRARSRFGFCSFPTLASHTTPLLTRGNMGPPANESPGFF